MCILDEFWMCLIFRFCLLMMVFIWLCEMRSLIVIGVLVFVGWEGFVGSIYGGCCYFE